MYLQLDTQFNPFTFDEMMKPLLYYKEAYDAAEAQYSEMAQNAEMWRDVATKENSPIANAMYQRFATEFNSAANDFNKGMTASNRGALLGLKKRYAQEIVPIARAYEAMKEANDLRLKAGPDAEFEVREYNSIDPFLGGGTANNRYLSKEAITKKTAALTEAAVNSVLRDYDISPALGGQVWEIVQHTGGSLKELEEALKLGLSDHPIVGNILSEVRQRMIKEIPFENYDDIGKKNILGAIDTGIYVGLDKPVRSFQANAGYVSPYQSMALGLQAAESGMSWDGTNKRWAYNPLADPKIAAAAFKASLTSDGADGITEFAALPGDYFYDVKYPEKSKWLSNESVEDEEGFEPIVYNSVEASRKWDNIIKEKTGNKTRSIKDAIDNVVRSFYPNASQETLEKIIRNTLIIQVNEDGNIRFRSKNISAINPSKLNISMSSTAESNTNEGLDPTEEEGSNTTDSANTVASYSPYNYGLTGLSRGIS